MNQNTISVPRPFSLLAKPTGATCNLDCKYCFFLSKEMLYPGDRFRMSDIRQLLETNESNWLPAPDAPFYVLLPLYWPKTEPPSILPPGAGTWNPPGIEVAN